MPKASKGLTGGEDDELSELLDQKEEVTPPMLVEGWEVGDWSLEDEERALESWLRMRSTLRWRSSMAGSEAVVEERP